MNFIREAENTLRHYKQLLRSLEYMDRRISKLISQNKPKELSAISYDADRVSGGKQQEEAINMLCELQTLTDNKRETEELLNKVDKILEDISDYPGCEVDGLVLKLWYIEGKSKEEIAEEIHYSSRDTIYRIRNRAIRRLAVLLFGKRAMEAI